MSRPPWSDELIAVGAAAAAHGLLTSHGGNASVRRPAGGALITRTGAMLSRLTPRDLVVVDAQGTPLDEAPHDEATDDERLAGPSSDTAIHLAIYDALRETEAVLHTHPVYATARAFGVPTIEPINLEAVLFLGRVPVVVAEWTGSAAPVAEALRECPIVVVRGHGAYARGRDPWDALRVTSALEEAARILARAGR